MSSNIGARPLLIIGVAIIVFLGWGIYSSIEFYDDKEQTAWSLEALGNPYLAAQQFMQQSDINSVEADSLIGLDTLDGVATVLITDANQVVNPRQLERVLSWLETGGNLIVTANSLDDSEDLLLKEFNVNVTWRHKDDSKEDEDGTDFDQPDNDNAENDTEEDKPSISESLRKYNQQIDEGKTPEEIGQLIIGSESLTNIDFGDDIGNLEIAFSSYRVLTHPYSDGKEVDESSPQPFSWSASEHGIHMMQFNVAEGLLTIISDPTIWTSNRIDQHDHAYLLWVLSSKEGGFAILHPTLRDSIWVLISRHAPEFLIALALSIALWLWHLGHRFGRIVPRDSGAGRALSEHFSATANYLWHRKAGNQLIDPVRQQIFRRASIALPEFASASNDPARQIALIGKHCGLEAVTVDIALNTRDFNETTFVRTVKLLKYIEQSL
jgi:hypothetical protein